MHGGFCRRPAHQTAPSLALQVCRTPSSPAAPPTRVLIATLPKSGTTWLKSLVFAIVARDQQHAPGDDGQQHPLLRSSPHDLVPFLHYIYEKHRSVSSAVLPLLEAMPPPRVLAAQAPLSALPASVAASGCRVVYMCRDPKDALVSFWHYLRKANPPGDSSSSALPTTTPFAELFTAFCDGVSPFGPAWDHMAEYWKQSVARTEDVMFLRYERLKEDTVGTVKRLAEFLGRPFTDDEVAGGVPEAVVALCGIEWMRSVGANRDGEYGVGWKVKNSAFFRKGEVGDWKDHMTPEMARRLDGIVDDKLRGSGLSLVRG